MALSEKSLYLIAALEAIFQEISHVPDTCGMTTSVAYSAAEELDIPCEIYEASVGGRGHYFSRIEGVFVDFSFGQFVKDSNFPLLMAAIPGLFETPRRLSQIEVQQLTKYFLYEHPLGSLFLDLKDELFRILKTP